MDSGFCLLMLVGFAVAAFLIQVVLPIYLVIKVALWIARYSQTGELPWDRKPAPAGQKPGLEAAFARDRAAAQAPADKVAGLEAALAAAKAEAAALAAAKVRREDAEYNRKMEELAGTMKAQGRLDRLALAYYVEASLRDGCEAGAVKAALRAKGWAEADVEAAFLACGAGQA